MTTSNKPHHALSIYVLMACIKSVFTAFSPTGATGGNFPQLAQFVKIWSMRPTVDNVYSRRRSLYLQQLNCACTFYVWDTHGLPRCRLSRLFKFLTTILRLTSFTRIIRFHEQQAERQGFRPYLHSTPPRIGDFHPDMVP